MVFLEDRLFLGSEVYLGIMMIFLYWDVYYLEEMDFFKVMSFIIKILTCWIYILGGFVIIVNSWI